MPALDRPTRLSIVFALLLTGLPFQARGQTHGDSARALHLLSRATWSPRAGDLDAILELGRDRWLERQLQPGRIDDARLDGRLAMLPTISLTMGELYRDFSPRPEDIRAAQRAQAMRDSGNAMMDPAAGMTAEQRRERQERSPQRVLGELVTAKLQRAVYSERQLEDVMTDFWFNHFNVHFQKGQVRYLIGDYERHAIRPHVFGSFEDMLLATAQHPAMLFYLDNWQSVHVDSSAINRRGRGGAPAERARNRGLNENYARELLELHTLGVDGGYTQEDVVAVARAFTGWSFEPYNARQREQQRMQGAGRPAMGGGRGGIGRGGIRGGIGGSGRGGAGGMQPRELRGEGDVPFVFRPQLHDRGDKVVLGRKLRANRGIEDGLDVIRLVARHPSTAKHIATKLVERFVSDEPRPELVAHIAAVFQRTEGDLREVTRALFTAEPFYAQENRGTKVKSPYELVVSALRATNAEFSTSRRAAELLRTMGHLPYTEPAPTGFPASSEDWVNSGAMLNRMNFGLDLAAGRVDGVRLDAALILGDTSRGDGEAVLAHALRTLLPGIDTARLAQAIREDVAAQTEQNARLRAQRSIGLVLGSPEFQRR